MSWVLCGLSDDSTDFIGGYRLLFYGGCDLCLAVTNLGDDGQDVSDGLNGLVGIMLDFFDLGANVFWLWRSLSTAI